MNHKTPPTQVWPPLRARDARGLIRFLVDAFGFEETVAYGEGDRVDHAQLSWPAGGGIMLRSARGELHAPDYGSRDFAVLDPEGNHWSFGTYPGEPRA